MKQLLEAGVHFGHPTRKWNPKMKKYIFTSRDDRHILNLEQTVELINKAYAFVREIAESGKSVLFVGTKKQAKEAIEEEAQRCGMFYVSNRWLGGTLTNFKTIRTRVDRLNKLNLMEKTGEFELLTKKEVQKLKAERDSLDTNLGGIREMRVLPGCMFVVDLKKEHIAIREAKALNIPIVGLVDTNCDPDEVDYVIPGNDDAIRGVKLIAGTIADAVIEGRDGEEGLAKVKEERENKEQETSAKTAPTTEESTEAAEEKPAKKVVAKKVETEEVEKPVAKTAKKATETVAKTEKAVEKKEKKTEATEPKKETKKASE